MIYFTTALHFYRLLVFILVTMYVIISHNIGIFSKKFLIIVKQQPCIHFFFNRYQNWDGGYSDILVTNRLNGNCCINCAAISNIYSLNRYVYYIVFPYFGSIVTTNCYTHFACIFLFF